MKTIHKVLLLFISIAFLMVVTSCDTDPSPQTYTVWDIDFTYAQFQALFEGSPPELPDNTFREGFFGNWDSVKAGYHEVYKDYKHSWTEAQIKTWFRNQNISQADTDTWTAWLLNRNNGWIASRTGDTVSMLFFEK